ncbi:MAG: methyltransferase domain-containing protein [Planctomycetota bacterium]
MTSLEKHLVRFGLRRFTSVDYFYWAAKELGPRVAREVQTLLQPLEREGSNLADWQGFSNFTADPKIAPVVLSMHTDAVRAAGEAAAEAIGERKRILDLGSSTGYLATWYAARNKKARVTGMDFARNAVAEARRMAGALKIKNIEFVTGDFTKALPRGPFDAAVDTRAVECVRERAEAFRRVRGALAEDGILVSAASLKDSTATREWLGALHTADFRIASFEYAYHSDRGEPGALAVITAVPAGKGIWVEVNAACDVMRLGVALLGIGLNITRTGDAWPVGEVLPGTPAEKAGVKAKDRLAAVSDCPVGELDIHRLRKSVGEEKKLRLVMVRGKRKVKIEVTLW